MNDGPEDTELLVMDAWGAMMILYGYFKDHPEELPPFRDEIDQMRMTAQLLQDRAKEARHERAH